MRTHVRQGWLLPLLALSVLFLTAASAQAADVEQRLTTITELGKAAVSLDEEEPRVEYWLDLPGNWALEEGGTIDVVYSAPAAGVGVAALRVTINGKQSPIVQLPKEPVELETLSFPVPPLRPLPNGLHVVVEYLPRGADQGCRPPDERVVIVREMTRFDLRYSRRPADEDLVALPYPLSYPRGDEPLETVFVLDHRHDEAAASEAAALALAIGRKATGTPLHFSVVEPGEPIDADAANVIVIGEASLSVDLPCRPAEGLALCRRRVRADRAVLWVLGDAESRSTLISGLLDGPPDPVAARIEQGHPDPWSLPKPTFADLGLPQMLVEGSGEHEQSLYLRRPRGLNLDAGSSLHLHVTRSEDMDGSASAFVNDVAVVRAGPGSLDELGFAHGDFPMEDRLNEDETGMPADFLVLTLKVEQNTMLEADPDCDPSVELWTLIHPDSYFDLDPRPPEDADLRWFPHPFVDARALAPVRLIVDPVESPLRGDSLAAAMQVAAAIGAGIVHTTPEVRVESALPPAPGDFIVLATSEHPWRRAPEFAALPWARPYTGDELPIGEMVGTLIFEPNPLGTGQLLVVDGEPGSAEVVARALRRDRPRGVRVAVAEHGSVTVDRGAVSVIRSWLNHLNRTLNFDERHWMFLGTNLVLVAILRRRRAASRREESVGAGANLLGEQVEDGADAAGGVELPMRHEPDRE